MSKSRLAKIEREIAERQVKDAARLCEILEPAYHRHLSAFISEVERDHPEELSEGMQLLEQLSKRDISKLTDSELDVVAMIAGISNYKEKRGLTK